MPFLRLTRDRRGIENTFLLHSDHPGARPRVLYWYRTAPGIGLGRAPLDEEAIRTIEERHPDLDFDWPAILALSEVMTPEDEEAPARARKKPRRGREDVPAAPTIEEEGPVEPIPTSADESVEGDSDRTQGRPASSRFGLLEELVGREIAARLRSRYAEIVALINERATDPVQQDRWRQQADGLDADAWSTPQEVLDGVRAADALYDRLRGELLRS